MNNPKFITKKARDGQSYFVLTAKNGQIVLQSQMYKTLSGAKSGIRSIKRNVEKADIEYEG